MTNRWHNYFEDGAVCFWTSSIIEHIPALRSPKEGYVERAEDWEFSSAAWYAEGGGPISIDWFDE